MSEHQADKYQRRIAFNIAKQYLLGKEHNPLIPQTDIFLRELNKFTHDFGSLSSEDEISKLSKKLLKCKQSEKLDNPYEFLPRTYESGWKGLQRPQSRVQTILDKIAKKNPELLVDWNKRFEKNQELKKRKSNSTIDYLDKVTLSYLPGVEMTPSKWINDNENNDLLNNHFKAFDLMCQPNCDDKNAKCLSFLDNIHTRWNPCGDNCFYELLGRDFYWKTTGNYIEINTKNLINESDLGKVINNKNRVDASHSYESESLISVANKNNMLTFDFFSPTSIHNFLIEMPLYFDVANNPLFHFWLLEYGSSVAAFHGYLEKIRNNNKDSKFAIGGQLHIVDAAYKLFWSNNSVESCFSRISLIPNLPLIDKYFEVFTFMRRHYRLTLAEFGIDYRELIDDVTNYEMRSCDN